MTRVRKTAGTLLGHGPDQRNHGRGSGACPERVVGPQPTDTRNKVPDALRDIRRHLKPVSERPWPPAFFASAPGDGVRIADQADELLREGFAR